MYIYIDLVQVEQAHAVAEKARWDAERDWLTEKRALMAQAMQCDSRPTEPRGRRRRRGNSSNSYCVARHW